jgi:hypothetical protein
MGLTAARREELAREMAGYAEMADRRRRRSLLTPPPPYERAPAYVFSLHSQSDTNNDTCSG